MRERKEERLVYFVLRNWLTHLWRLGKFKICRMDWQAGVPEKSFSSSPKTLKLQYSFLLRNISCFAIDLKLIHSQLFLQQNWLILEQPRIAICDMWSTGKPPGSSEHKEEGCFYRGKGKFKRAVLNKSSLEGTVSSKSLAELVGWL